jgi:alpha-beta hydrolase superfamily lysophospholipase
LFNLVRRAVDEAPYVRIPVLTMAGTKDDLIGTLQIRRLHDRLGGEKEWVSFEGGPHLLLHWKHYDGVLQKVLTWIEVRLPTTIGPRQAELVPRAAALGDQQYSNAAASDF